MLKTWADQHCPAQEKILVDPVKVKLRKGFDETVYMRKKSKPRHYDDCADLMTPERWKKKIIQIVPRHKYPIFQKIFNLPPLKQRLGPERDYSIQGFTKKASPSASGTTVDEFRSKMKLSMSGTTLSRMTIESLASSQSDFSMIQMPSKKTRKRDDDIIDQDELYKVDYSRTDIRKRPDSPMIREGRFLKWKLAWLKSKESGKSIDDMYVNPPTELVEEVQDCLEDKRSPYQLFLTKTDEEVASTWRKSVRKKGISELSLEEQGAAAAEEIAKEFVHWMHFKAGFTDSLINETMLKDMFRVDLSQQALKCLEVGIHELPTIPVPVAKQFNEPHMNERAAIHRHIIWDSFFERQPERKYAFGTSVPNPHRKWNKNTKENWFSSDVVPEDLHSGALLWRDLFETPVLAKFCVWLLENPHFARPKYLLTSGYLNAIAKKLDPHGKIKSFPRMRAKIKHLKKMNKNVLWSRNEKLRQRIPEVYEDETVFKDHNKGFTFIHRGYAE